uniref:SHSP domain-containing protein n=2 Tax=Caenorhabditis tropicalis TaxID=1561998 RepID=A0A1I7U5T9_9PELO
MDYMELFCLSLCSKKSMTLIQRVGWREIRRISYEEYDKRIFKNEDALFVTIESENSVSQSILSMFQMNRNTLGLRKESEVNVSGVKTSCRAPDGDLSFGLRFIFDFQVPTYVVRDDGIIADLLIENRTLFFSVKKCTEKQMMDRGSIS